MFHTFSRILLKKRVGGVVNLPLEASISLKLVWNRWFNSVLFPAQENWTTLRKILHANKIKNIYNFICKPNISINYTFNMMKIFYELRSAFDAESQVPQFTLLTEVQDYFSTDQTSQEI